MSSTIRTAFYSQDKGQGNAKPAALPFRLLDLDLAAAGKFIRLSRLALISFQLKTVS